MDHQIDVKVISILAYNWLIVYSYMYACTTSFTTKVSWLFDLSSKRMHMYSESYLFVYMHCVAVMYACPGCYGNRKWSNCLMSVPYGKIMRGVPLISAGC